MTRWYHALVPLLWIVGAASAVSALLWWRVRCSHPNPHYVRAQTALDASGRTITVEAARYICYECGRSWVARQRDPAWHATSVVQKFSGHDPQKAAQAATRASAEEAKRRQLAVSRAGPAEPASATRGRGEDSVVDMRSRKPA